MIVILIFCLVQKMSRETGKTYPHMYLIKIYPPVSAVVHRHAVVYIFDPKNWPFGALNSH